MGMRDYKVNDKLIPLFLTRPELNAVLIAVAYGIADVRSGKYFMSIEQLDAVQRVVDKAKDADNL